MKLNVVRILVTFRLVNDRAMWNHWTRLQEQHDWAVFKWHQIVFLKHLSKCHSLSHKFCDTRWSRTSTSSLTFGHLVWYERLCYALHKMVINLGALFVKVCDRRHVITVVPERDEYYCHSPISTYSQNFATLVFVN